MTMPDRAKTRPWLVEQVKQAEHAVAQGRRMATALGASTADVNSIVMKKPMTELAVAGTLLALADAEWAREAVAVKPPTVTVTQSPPKEPMVPADPVEMHAGKPLY